MTITNEDKQILADAGFIDYEINEYDIAHFADGTPQHINILTPEWQSAIKSRNDWRQDKVDRGWTKEEIIREVTSYYRLGEKRNPFDFIQAQGSLTDADIQRRNAKRVDYIEARKRKARREIEEGLGSYPK